MLGASDTQQVAIERAKAQGVYVITTDNRPDNPGHRLADECYSVSTTDLDGALALAKSCRIDGVISYASDPGALTAAYIAHHLALPGDPLEAVRKAQDKFLLRCEQAKLGHPVPECVLGDDLVGVKRLWASAKKGLVVKPTDRAGSVGVCIFHTPPSWSALMAAIDKAKAVSFHGRAIVEARLARTGFQFGGDYLVKQGRVLFAAYADQYLFQTPTTQAGLGNLNPSTQPAAVLAEATDQVAALVAALGLSDGVYNTDVCVSDGKVVVLDFGARLGGNWLAEVHRYATGVDLTDLAIRLALGEPLPDLGDWAHARAPRVHAGHLVIHADREGTFQSMAFSAALESVVVKKTVSVRPNQRVSPYRGTPDRLGLLLISSPDRQQLLPIYAAPQAHFGLALGLP